MEEWERFFLKQKGFGQWDGGEEGAGVVEAGTEDMMDGVLILLDSHSMFVEYHGAAVDVSRS